MPAPEHVLLNALFLDPGGSGGPETYLRGLVPALRSEFPGTRFEVATTRAGAAALRADGWRDVIPLPCDEGQRAHRAFAELVLLPRVARRAGAQVLHDLASTGPRRTPGVAHVVTLHDVTFFREATFNPITTFGMRRMVTGAARDADALITAAAAARDEIAATLHLDPARFTIVHHGAGRTDPVEPADEDTVRARYQLPRESRVVLCVASKRPHKNQELLIRALARLPESAVLVLAGHPEPYDARLRALADETGVAGRVRFADYVPDDDLEALWRIAAVAAFPTRAEGFGLPVVEALARGVPVACSDIPVLREVGGGHVRTFPPDDPDTAARALAAAMDEPFDAAAARAWAGRFTWEAAARATFEVYERCTPA